MPREWHDRHAVNKIEDSEIREFYRRIVADKKPYFMIYIYPAMKKQYDNFVKSVNMNSLREFQLSIDELRAISKEELTERQAEFLSYADYNMPVGINECVMNKICKRIEEKFDGYLGRHNSTVSFDYTILKGNNDYTSKQYSAIKKLMTEYNKRICNYAIYTDFERVDKYDSAADLAKMNADFEMDCLNVCSSSDILCDIVLDLCYTRNSTKRFAWSMCGHNIVQNLLKRNDYTIYYPELNSNGEFEYCGERYSVKRKVVGEQYDNCTE